MSDLIDDIDTLLRLPTNHLFAQIGSSSLEDGLGMADADNVEKGQTWFAKHRKQLQERICDSHLAALTRSQPNRWDNVLLVAAIADLISGICTGVSPFTVAALIIKQGISSLCVS